MNVIEWLMVIFVVVLLLSLFVYVGVSQYSTDKKCENIGYERGHVDEDFIVCSKIVNNKLVEHYYNKKELK